MNGTNISDGNAGRIRLALCVILAVLWFACVIAAAVPDGQTGTIAAALQALLLLVFVAIHGSLSNGWRGFFAYAGITLVVSMLLEATSIAHGFPFGFYVHNMPGPKPFGVPPAVPLGYVVLGWPAWTLARLITRPHPSLAANRFITPLVAAFIITGYDFTYDPIGATVLHMWTYRSPSGYFGVPLSNFLGWLFTSWVFFQIFALVEQRFPARNSATQGRLLWVLPCFIWAGTALQYPVKFAYAPAGISSAGSRTFVTADIYEASVVSALLTMVFIALVAAAHIRAGKNTGTS